MLQSNSGICPGIAETCYDERLTRLSMLDMTCVKGSVMCVLADPGCAVVEPVQGRGAAAGLLPQEDCPSRMHEAYTLRGMLFHR